MLKRLVVAAFLVAGCSREATSEADPPAQANRPATEAQASGVGGGPAGAMRTFGDWTASCDNLGDCTAFGFAAEEEPSGAFMRVDSPAGGGGPAVHVSTGEPDVEVAGDPQAVSVSVDGPKGASFTLPRATVEAPSGFMGRAQGADAQRLIGAIGGGRAVRVGVAGLPARTVSLNGAAAALLWMDERQGRAGTTAALRGRGDKPPAAGSGARPIPVVQRAKAEGRRAGALPRPAGLMERPEVVACREDSGEAAELMVEPLGAGANLYGVPCYSGAYNTAFRVFVSEADGTGLRPAPLEGLGPDEDGTLTNASFDAATMTLSEFNKGRGVGDCGVERSWTWDGSRFRLTGESRMELCRGLDPALWPVLHRAEVR